MGAWKCGNEIYLSPVLREVIKPTHTKDGFMSARESIFFRLLTYSSGGYEFESVKQFASITMMPVKQCQLVWDICIAHDVLRMVEFGYSTIEWLKEKGIYIPNSRQSKCKPQTNSKSKDDLEENQPIESTPTIVEETKPAINNQVDTILPRTSLLEKKAVRHNVFLTDQEVYTLVGQYGEKDLDTMLDYLSTYKAEKNRQYASDYQAICRWVVKWLAVTKNEAEKRRTLGNCDFQEWVTGK